MRDERQNELIDLNEAQALKNTIDKIDLTSQGTTFILTEDWKSPLAIDKPKM